MEFVGFRLASFDTPLWASPNRRTGRFNAVGDPPVQYLCLHPLGPWAELLRAEDRRSETEAAEFRARVWALRVLLDDVTVVDFARAAEFGITADDLVADDWSECQRLARSLRAETAAVQVPSAALPGIDNLVLFGPRVAIGYALDPIDDLDVPAGVAADTAAAPVLVLPHVRFRGMPHAGVIAAQLGTPYAAVI